MHISLEPLNCFRKTLRLKCALEFPISFCSFFLPSFFWKKSGDKTWLKMMLPTFQHWVSFLQYKKNLTSKKEILNSSVSSQKQLLLWGSHYIILCEKNNASEKVSTTITKTTKYQYVCYPDKKSKRWWWLSTRKTTKLFGLILRQYSSNQTVTLTLA